MKPKKAKVQMLLLVACFLMTSLFVLGINEETKGAPGGTFIYARPVSATIDPAASAGDQEVQNCYMVYDTLVTLDEDLEVIPSLAKEWEICDEFKGFTFHLREGVEFHCGHPFTAEAVKFSYDRLLMSGMQGIGSYSDMADEDSMEVIDDYTVRINLVRSYPGFLTDELVHAVHSVVCPVCTEAHMTEDDPYALEWMTRNACGTGPFTLEEWIPGDRMIFDKNTNYWNLDRLPHVDRVVFRIFEESSMARMWIERGEVHVAEGLTPDDFEALDKLEAVEVRQIDYPLTLYLMMDVSQPPFDDIFVRKAMAYAINYEEIMQEVERGQVVRAHGIMPEDIMGFNERPLPYHYSPEIAKELLALSDYPDGFSADILFTTERRASFSLMAEYIQAYLGDIGIEVNPWDRSLSGLNETQRAGNYGISLRQWSAGLPSPDEIAGWLFDMERGNGCWGWVGTFWYNDWAMNNVRNAREEFDPEKRAELYRVTDALVSEKAIFIPLFYSKKLIALAEDVDEFIYTPYLFGRFYTAKLK